MTIVTTCGGHTDEWASREQAIAKFIGYAASSEGSEHERYTSIILQLLEGKTICHD